MILTLCVFTFASNSYNIRIDNADDVEVSGSKYTIIGNVELSFTSDDIKRTLKSDIVELDTENKTLKASGNVELKQDDDTFSGDGLVLFWEELDIVVFDGNSSSSRSNSVGDGIEFYAVGKKISYTGDQNTVYFTDGIISTRKDDPNWSIKAKKIGLLGSDLFFKGATVKIGRVPVFYLPFFFYPGTTMTFNPSIGISSSKGMYINTTTEIYGKYPFGGSSSSSDNSLSASVLSFMDNKNEGPLVKDGIIYRPMKENEELSPLETWAKKSSSFFALFADVYKEYGPAIGFDTKNTFDNGLSFQSTTIVSYDSSFKYASENHLEYSKDNINIDLDIPFYSDPYVAGIYLNRNSHFGLDSIFGSYQFFPTTYSSSITSYDWNLDVDASFKKGNFSFDINSIQANMKYKYDYSKKAFTISEASLPYVSLSSSGTLLDIKGTSETVEKEKPYSSKIAENFYQELLSLDDSDSTEDTSDFLNGPEALRSTKKTYQAPYLNSTYSYRQTINNKYKTDFDPSKFSTDVSTSLNVNGRLPYNILFVQATLDPSYSFEKNYSLSEYNKQNLTLKSTLGLSLPEAGLKYNLNGKLYSFNVENNIKTDNNFVWDSNHISVHSLELSKTFGKFTLSVKQNLKPVKETLVPSVSYSDNGFKATLNASVIDLKEFEKTSFNFSYSKKNMAFTMDNSYDFSYKSWQGYKGVQTFSISLSDKDLYFRERLNLINMFESENMNLSLSYKNINATMSFKDKDFKKDTLKLDIRYNLSPIYMWKNRIGITSLINANLTYDFENVYRTTSALDMALAFSIKDFLDLTLSFKTSNSSYYKYFVNNTFDYHQMFVDLMNSLAIFDEEKRHHTTFNMSYFSLSLVHYMQDWNLYVDASNQIVTDQGKAKWQPQVSVYVKWKAIPELKVQNSYNGEKWEK